MSFDLPIVAHLDDIRDNLAENCKLLLIAPPGAGKTTLVPPALFHEKWLKKRKIILLAPRRLAARSAAARMAELLGEEVGMTVGYRVRMDSQISDITRIEVVTEGILTRRLQRDPGLEDIGLIIFDEFHERSLEADLALALCLDLQGVLHPDLRLLVMSATLEREPLARLLKNPPIIHCQGRQYPVESRFLGRQNPTGDTGELYRAVQEAVATGLGSILIFLPGAGEIRRLAKALNNSHPGPEWDIVPLYGRLDRRQQDLAIKTPTPGRKKIVLATNIAETSLTIEGINIVVDSGLERRMVHDPNAGMSRLVTRTISRSSAHQRKGRAGRTGPGLCLRLWSREYHHALVPARRPEILEADLTSLALELALWGVDSPESLDWLNPPPAAPFRKARELLSQLGALDNQGKVSKHGKAMATLPLHPRLAHMLLVHTGRTACTLAALISERDPLRFEPGCHQADLQLRMDILTKQTSHSCYQARIDNSSLRQIIRIAGELWQRLKNIQKTPQKEEEDLGILLASAYPDRIGQARDGRNGQFLLASGKGGFLSQHDHLAAAPYLVVAELDGHRSNSRIFLAANYSEALLRLQFRDNLHHETRIFWDEQRQAFTGMQETHLGALLIDTHRVPITDPEQISQLLLEKIREHGLSVLPWNKKCVQIRQRLQFLHRMQPETWPDCADEQLLVELNSWLGPFLDGMKGFKDLVRLDLRTILLNRVDYAQHSKLEELAPSHLIVPSGSRLPIDYGHEQPVLAVRVQEMFGASSSPAIFAGRQPILLHLLSPAGRPLQITTDLAGFWRGSWKEVRKEMKGRYPKHHWPENPQTARATSRAKSRTRSP